jgi:protein SCO1/2
MNVRTGVERPARFRAAGVRLGVLLAAIAVVAVAVKVRAVGPAAIMAPDFTLVDQNARPFTLSALRGHPVALFFGYTNCPDECPTTLAHLAKAMQSRTVPRDQRVAFITVDPQRDTPAALKRYVGLFNRDFIGLTGGLPALNPVYAAYRTLHRAEAVEPDSKNYFVSHGTTIYFVGRDGSIKGFGQWDDAIPEIARDFRDFQ